MSPATLVDCGCETRVHSDGSGVEIDYCELHEAAPDLLAALRAVRDWADGSCPLFDEHGVDGDGRPFVGLAAAAIAKAEGRS